MIKLTGRIMPKRLFGKIRIDYGPYNGTLQSKIVEPSTEDQSVVADNGYNALSLVLVKAAPLQEKTVTPSSQEQTVVPDVGVYGLSKVIVAPQGNHGLLEEITVTPKQEEQVFTPSEGFYGIDVVNVEAAPLEEVTIYPAYEVQRITPSEGYYGIGSIVVEAMDDPGSGGGGGDGEETEEIPSAESTAFGSEFATAPVFTGYYLYERTDTGMLKFPALPADYIEDRPYCIIFHQSNKSTDSEKGELEQVYRLWMCSGRPTYEFKSGASILNFNSAVIFEGSVYITNGTQTGVDDTWTYVNTTGAGFTLSMGLVWTNADIRYKEDKSQIYRFACSYIPDTESGEVAAPVEREALYTISGHSLNAIATAIQRITGASLMTPSEMISTLGILPGI